MKCIKLECFFLKHSKQVAVLPSCYAYMILVMRFMHLFLVSSFRIFKLCTRNRVTCQIILLLFFTLPLILKIKNNDTSSPFSSSSIISWCLLLEMLYKPHCYMKWFCACQRVVVGVQERAYDAPQLHWEAKAKWEGETE